MSSWAVVLGASTGTGAEIAASLARAPGLDLFGAHRGHHPEAARQVEAAVAAAGRRVVMHQGEVGSIDGVAAGLDALADALRGERVSFFVHSLASASVGRLASGDARQLQPRQVLRTFDVMTHSFLWWVQGLLDRDLLGPGARLLALTNPLDGSLLRDCGLIAASKAALEGYVRALALELGPRGHRVNLLRFATVITPAMRRVYGEEALERVVDTHLRMIPAGRMCTTEEVGRVVSFLAGPEADFFNGATIDFSGGMTSGLADLLLGSGA